MRSTLRMGLIFQLPIRLVVWSTAVIERYQLVEVVTAARGVAVQAPLRKEGWREGGAKRCWKAFFGKLIGGGGCEVVVFVIVVVVVNSIRMPLLSRGSRVRVAQAIVVVAILEGWLAGRPVGEHLITLF